MGGKTDPERVGRRIRRQLRLPVLKPPPGERVARLVKALLGAEQDGSPGQPVRRLPPYPLPFTAGAHHRLKHSGSASGLPEKESLPASSQTAVAAEEEAAKPGTRHRDAGGDDRRHEASRRRGTVGPSAEKGHCEVSAGPDRASAHLVPRARHPGTAEAPANRGGRGGEALPAQRRMTDTMEAQATAVRQLLC